MHFSWADLSWLRSHRWRSFGDCRSFHVRLDNISARPLDCSNHRELLFWRRVSSLNTFLLKPPQVFDRRQWRVALTYILFVCCRTVLVFSGIFTFLVDAYPLYAASALAANSFMRSSFAAAFPLFGVQSKFDVLPEKFGVAY